MGDCLPKVVAANLILFVELWFLVGVELYKLLLRKLHWVGLLRFLWKICLCIPHSLLERLKNLLISINEHFIIEVKFKGHIRDCSEIEGQVAMIASHSVEHSYKLYPVFAYLNKSKDLLNLYFDRIGENMFVKDGVEEKLWVLFKHRGSVSFLLVKFDPKKFAELF